MMSRPDVTQMFTSTLAVNGVTTTASGRRFACAQPRGDTRSPQLVEIIDGKAIPFGHAAAFVGVNSVRVGPDGALWVVDRGSAGIGKPLAAAPRLIRFDLVFDRVQRVFDLSDLTNAHSFVDDVRFNDRRAYLTDAGSPGIIVLDLVSGAGYRVLEGTPAVTAQRPLVAEGRPLLDARQQPVVIHADQLEVSPDGAWLYVQPCCGGMSRIETRLLDDVTIAASDLADAVRPFADTPSTGGTAMDASGVIYLSDVDTSRILTITPDGAVSVLIDDPRLVWVDAMWIDDAGNLVMPAPQLNRSAGLNGGVEAADANLSIFQAAIGATPLRR